MVRRKVCATTCNVKQLLRGCRSATRLHSISQKATLTFLFIPLEALTCHRQQMLDTKAPSLPAKARDLATGDPTRFTMYWPYRLKKAQTHSRHAQHDLSNIAQPKKPSPLVLMERFALEDLGDPQTLQTNLHC